MLECLRADLRKTGSISCMQPFPVAIGWPLDGVANYRYNEVAGNDLARLKYVLWLQWSQLFKKVV